MPTPKAETSLLDDLQKRLDQASATLPDVHPRKMFGCYALFTDKSIYALIWKTGRIGLRLTDATLYAELMAMDGAIPWTIDETAMSHWVLVPERFYQDSDLLEQWVQRAYRLSLDSTARPKAKKRKGEGFLWPN